MTVPASYFDKMYARDPDPWGFETRWYEQRKYAVTLASLPRERYRRGIELGCSVGVLSAQLAERCESLLAVDVAQAAVDTARQRMASHSHVDVERLALPAEWPAGTFDLIVMSEVGYYFAESELRDLLTKAVAALESDGALIAVHWRHPVDDYPLLGDQLHATIASMPGLERQVHHEEEDFVLDVFAAHAGMSVARETGLLS